MVEITRSSIGRARPTSFAALDGYLGALEAAFCLLDRRSIDRRPVEELVRAIGKLSRAFAMARSSARRFEGELAMRRSKERAARKALEEALRLARKTGMLRDETAAREAMARLRLSAHGEQIRGASQ
jgi:hypothetical protein